ncbi:MAG TPA: amidohydrolase, partial [Candidatus Eisenbacteria bacterium]|nr:amidohydrolase [Candidatus Eisenbacteria bacterium]
GAWPRVGALAPGAAADLVVWDRDLHAAAPGALAGARPALTAAGGEIVYESPRRGAAGTAARAPGTGG